MITTREITKEIRLGMLDLRAFSAQNGLLLKREQERAGTLLLLEHLLGRGDFALAYTAEKKPYLQMEKRHISISHSHDQLVIIVNETENTGIDIELIRDKVLKIRHKFLNETEAAFAGTDVEKLIAIWAAKEALYKYYGLGGIDFKHNLSVQNFDAEFIFGKIETTGYKKKFRLKKERIEDYVMVYLLNELPD